MTCHACQVPACQTKIPAMEYRFYLELPSEILSKLG